MQLSQLGGVLGGSGIGFNSSVALAKVQQGYIENLYQQSAQINLKKENNKDKVLLLLTEE